MPTTTTVPARRPQAARRSWLLVLVVLGVLGMHGLTGGTGTTGAHHSWTSSAAASSSTPAHDMHGEEPDSVTTLGLCLVLLMSLGVGLLVARRAAWPVRAYGLPARLPLPAAPHLQMSTPVPRFTVMRC